MFAIVSVEGAPWQLSLKCDPGHAVALREQFPAKEKLTEWRELAIKHLEIGIAERMRSTPADSTSPDDLIRGKMTLAQIRNLSGIYHTVGKTAGSIELLTAEPEEESPLVKLIRELIGVVEDQTMILKRVEQAVARLHSQ